jgi:hypothetical protein
MTCHIMTWEKEGQPLVFHSITSEVIEILMVLIVHVSLNILLEFI